jgi:hypothetical protein
VAADAPAGLEPGSPFGHSIAAMVSMPVEISPEVPVENSPLRCVIRLC